MDPNLSIENRRSLEAKSEDNTSDNEGDFQEEGADLSEDLYRAVDYGFETAHKARNEETTVREISKTDRLRHSPSKP